MTLLNSEKIVLEKENVIATPLLSGKVLLTYNKNNNEEINIDNISVGISSAIAAYSRVTMNQFLIKYVNNIYSVNIF